MKSKRRVRNRTKVRFWPRRETLKDIIAEEQAKRDPINLSDFVLTDAMKEVLRLGTSFAPTPTRPIDPYHLYVDFQRWADNLIINLTNLIRIRGMILSRNHGISPQTCLTDRPRMLMMQQKHSFLSVMKAYLTQIIEEKLMTILPQFKGMHWRNWWILFRIMESSWGLKTRAQDLCLTRSQIMMLHCWRISMMLTARYDKLDNNPLPHIIARWKPLQRDGMMNWMTFIQISGTGSQV